MFQTQSSFPSKGKAECCMLQASCTWGVDFLDSIRNFSMTISPPQPPSVEEICCGSSICNLKTQEQMMATGVMFHIATSLLLIVITNMISHTHPRRTHSPPCPAPKKKEKKSLKIPEVPYARWPSSAHRLPDSTDLIQGPLLPLSSLAYTRRLPFQRWNVEETSSSQRIMKSKHPSAA